MFSGSSSHLFTEDFMKRLAFAASILVLAACAPKEEAPAETAPAPSAATEPAPASPAVEPTPAPETRIAAMNLMCGGEPFRVAFEDARAVVLNADGSNTELPKLEPSTTSEPGVTSYTNGTMTFAKSGGGDTPTVIRFARGRMAFQDCAIAQN
jgi:streptogramin lyase